jgi:hypothetical protein
VPACFGAVLSSSFGFAGGVSAFFLGRAMGSVVRMWFCPAHAATRAGCHWNMPREGAACHEVLNRIGVLEKRWGRRSGPSGPVLAACVAAGRQSPSTTRGDPARTKARQCARAMRAAHVGALRDYPTRVAENGDKQEKAHAVTGGGDYLLSEVDLQLLPGAASRRGRSRARRRAPLSAGPRPPARSSARPPRSPARLEAAARPRIACGWAEVEPSGLPSMGPGESPR